MSSSSDISLNFVDFYDNIDNKYIEFSNFANRPIIIDGIKWQTSEHYFHAEKINQSDYAEEYRQIINTANTPFKAKQLGNMKLSGRFSATGVLNPPKDRRLLKDIISEYKSKGIRLRDDWEEIKEDVMYKAIKAKFTQHQDLQKLLLSTGNKIIREASPTDSYWGIGKDGKGLNRLGILLMKLREEFRAQMGGRQEAGANSRLKNNSHMEVLYTELHRRELYQKILNDLQGVFKKDGKKYTETGKLLARWIFNCLIEPSSSDPVFQTGNKYSRKGLEEDFSYLGLHSTYGGPETTGKQFDILLTDAYNKLNNDSLKERIKEDITKNEKIEIKNGKLLFRGETYPDLGGLGIKEDTRPYALALQIRYKYLGIDTLGLACDYQSMGYKKTDNVLEGFASAFNHYFQRWCSAFPDLETVFGSEGSFWKHKLDEKIVLLNPPFDNILIEQMFEKVRNSSETSSFNAVIPAWLDSPPILRLFEDSRVKRIIIYEKGKVQFIDYMKGVKFSPCGIIEVMVCK